MKQHLSVLWQAVLLRAQPLNYASAQMRPAALQRSLMHAADARVVSRMDVPVRRNVHRR